MAFKDLRFHRPSQQQGVLVTGGTGGLGQETVRVLAENGCLVVFQYHRNEECASRLVADLKEKGLRVESIRFSLDGSSDYDAFMAEVEEKIGPPHAFIHCSAPEFELSRFEDNWLDVFNHMIVLNVKAFLKIANGCLGKMKYRQDGVVMGVLSESVMGDRVPQFSAYASAKMALASLLKDLSLHVDASGVRVLGVLPGAFRIQNARPLQTPWPTDVRDAFRSRWPIGIEPREIAHLFLRILNQRKEYANGSFVAINSLDGERKVEYFGFLPETPHEKEILRKQVADVQQEALEDAVGSVDFEQEKLEGIFREVFKLDEDEPVENARIGQGGWDSLRHLDLLMSIEDGLDVSFHDVGGNTLVSFPQILEVVREKKRHV